MPSQSFDETFVKFDDKQWSDTVKQLDQVMTDLEKLVESDPRAKAGIVGSNRSVAGQSE
jgi:hypothetical protein